ncbi:MAG: hypothetical protein PHI16_02350 [Methanocellales archaeon]|nr:hypothetical protein [Methanocellales archaeon]
MSLTRAQIRTVIEDDIIDRTDKTVLVDFSINWALEYIDKTAAARGFAFSDLNREDVTSTVISCTCTAAVTDIISVSVDIPTGTRVVFSTTDTLPAGLSIETDYWAHNESTTTIKVSTTYLNCWSGVYVDITDTGTGTHTVTAYRERFAKPSSCRYIYDMRLIDGASSRKLIQMTPRVTDLYVPFAAQNSTGRPTHYIEWKDWIQLYPIPDDTYIIKMRYFKWQDAFALDTATAEIDHIDDIIINAAAMYVWKILGEPEQASLMEQAVEVSLAKCGKLEKLKPDLVLKPNMGSYARSNSDTIDDPFVMSQR